MAGLLFAHGPFAWYPHSAGGRPSHAFQFGPLYPLVFAATLLPLWLLYAILKLSFMVAAGYGMLRFARDYLGFDARLALAAGVVHAFNSQTQYSSIVHVPFNFVFPLVFVWSLGIAPRGERYSWPAAGAGLALLSLLAYPALTIPFYAASQLLLILVLNPRYGAATPRLLLRWAIFWTGFVLVSLPVLYALWDYTPETQRTLWAYARSPLGVAADFGTELVVKSLLVFFVGGAVVLAPRSSLVRRAVIAAVLPFGLSVFFYSSASNFLRGSFLDKIDLGHFNFVQNFFLTVLAFAGLRVLLAHRERAPIYALGGALAVLATARFMLRSSIRGRIRGDPAVFSLSRENPPLSDAYASCCNCLSPSRRAPLPEMPPAPS